MKKKIVIVLIALLSYFCIVILIYGVNILINKQNYLVINNSAVFKYNKNKWDKVDNKDSITGNKYYTYVDNEYYGITRLQYYNDKTYVYNKNNKAVFYDEYFLAYSGKKKIIPVKYDTLSFDDNDYRILNNYLNELKISNYDDILYANKYQLDFDNDGIIETLYNVSNAFTDSIPSEIFSLLFINDNGVSKAIHNFIYHDKISDVKNVILYSIIDIDSDGKYDIVTDESSFGSNNQCYNLYNYNGEEVKTLYEC